jgi:hypothetical protein
MLRLTCNHLLYDAHHDPCGYRGAGRGLRHPNVALPPEMSAPISQGTSRSVVALNPKRPHQFFLAIGIDYSGA